MTMIAPDPTSTHEPEVGCAVALEPPRGSRFDMSAARVSLILATVLTGLSAGFFFTYQASVTLGLAEVDHRTYVATFQAINDTVRNPAFFIVFAGPLPALVVALALNRRASGVTRALIGAALALYVVGMTVTFAGNVPLNEQLADYTDLADATIARAGFENDWNRFNLIRTIAVMVGFASLVVGVIILGRRRSNASGPTA